jgi:hypothetical protein
MLGISNPAEDEAFDYGLHLINAILTESGYTLSHWASMPQSNIDWNCRITNILIAEQMDYDLLQERHSAEENVSHFNEEQHQAFDAIMHAVNIQTATVLGKHSSTTLYHMQYVLNSGLSSVWPPQASPLY